MTISNTQSSVTQQGTGTTNSFAFQFLMPATSSCVVQLYNTNTSVLTTLITGSFTVTGVGNSNGGTVIYPTTTASPFITSGIFLTISRIVPLTQTTSIADQGVFAPEAIENALDYETMGLQQLATAIMAIEAAIAQPVPPVVNPSPTIPTGSTSSAGILLLATHAQASAGTNDTAAMTPLDTAISAQQFWGYAADGSTTTNTLTVTLVPAPQSPSALANGFEILVRPAHSISSTSVTLSVNGGSAMTVKKASAAGLVHPALGDIIQSIDARFYASPADSCAVLENPLSQATPGLPGGSGVVITNGTASTNISLSANYLIAVNSSGFVSPVTASFTTTINCLTTGANGMDAGGLVATSEIHIYGIYNATSNTWAGIASLNSSGPSPLPSGYTYSIYLGAMLTGAGATFLRTIQRDDYTTYTVGAGTTTVALPSPSISASQTRTAIQVRGTTGSGNAKYIPSTATAIDLILSGQSAANNRLVVAPNSDVGYTATPATASPPPLGFDCNLSGVQALVSGRLMIEGVTTGTSASLYYTSGAGAGSGNAVVQIYGWKNQGFA